VVVFGAVKVLSVGWVTFPIILCTFDIEVANPTEFTVDISIFCNSCVVRKSCAFHFILIEWVHSLLLRKFTDSLGFSLSELLVKVHLEEVMICSIVAGRSDMMTVIPISVSKFTVVSKIVDYLLVRNFEPSLVSHSCGKRIHSLGVFTPKGRITVFSSNWWSHLIENGYFLWHL